MYVHPKLWRPKTAHPKQNFRTGTRRTKQSALPLPPPFPQSENREPWQLNAVGGLLTWLLLWRPPSELWRPRTAPFMAAPLPRRLDPLSLSYLLRAPTMPNTKHLGNPETQNAGSIPSPPHNCTLPKNPDKPRSLRLKAFRPPPPPPNKASKLGQFVFSSRKPQEARTIYPSRCSSMAQPGTRMPDSFPPLPSPPCRGSFQWHGLCLRDAFLVSFYLGLYRKSIHQEKFRDAAVLHISLWAPGPGPLDCSSTAPQEEQQESIYQDGRLGHIIPRINPLKRPFSRGLSSRMAPPGKVWTLNPKP